MKQFKFTQLLIFIAALAIVGLLFVTFKPLVKIKRAGLQVEYNNNHGHASVFLNEQFLEKAPLSEKNIQSGDYILKIVPDEAELAEFSTPISLNDGTLTVVVYNPGPNSKQSSASIYELFPRDDLKDLGAVNFETYPENALLSFDGGSNQYTPVTLTDLTPGDHRFAISLPSYATQEQNLQILPGYETKITVILAKLLESTLNTTEADLASKKEASDSGQNPTTATTSTNINGARVKIKATNFFVDGQEVLRVRSAANNNATELGFAQSQTEYAYLGNPDEASSSASWYQIQFNDRAGWVNASFAELILN